MNKNPLVSICTTFFNAERYIHRVIDSCLNQTYKNIEIVIVDDASTDGSENVIREYMARDPRVKYFKNDKRIGVSESFLKMSMLAKGDFSMVIGADDWLARNYIENGMRSFLAHPDTAGIIPKSMSLYEVSNDKFKFISVVLDKFNSPKKFLSEWFIKRIYRPTCLYVSGYALVRSKDLVSAMDYYIKNYYHNPSTSVPEELRSFFKRALGIDSVVLTEILTRYKNFVFDSSLNYIKVEHSENQTFDFGWGSATEIFKNAYYYLLIYTYIYKSLWPKFYKGMKIYLGAQMLSSACIYFFKHGMRPSSLNFAENKKFIYGFWKELSIFDIILVVVYAFPMAIGRIIDFVTAKFAKRHARTIEAPPIFIAENFLDSDGRFKVI